MRSARRQQRLSHQSAETAIEADVRRAGLAIRQARSESRSGFDGDMSIAGETAAAVSPRDERYEWASLDGVEQFGAWFHSSGDQTTPPCFVAYARQTGNRLW